MTKLAKWVLAGGLFLMLAGSAQAQVAIIGNPVAGNGIYLGNPGYANPYYGTGATYYSSGYSGYAPVTTYSTGYVAPYGAYGVPYRPYAYRAPYRAYGYGGYGGYRSYGFRPFGGLRRW